MTTQQAPARKQEETDVASLVLWSYRFFLIPAEPAVLANAAQQPRTVLKSGMVLPDPHHELTAKQQEERERVQFRSKQKKEYHINNIIPISKGRVVPLMIYRNIYFLIQDYGSLVKSSVKVALVFPGIHPFWNRVRLHY